MYFYMTNIFIVWQIFQCKFSVFHDTHTVCRYYYWKIKSRELVNMAALMFSRVICLVLLFCCFLQINAVEEVVVVHAPDSIKFLSSEPVHSSFLGDIFSAMLAYTLRSNINWHSLGVVSPWKRPEAIVILELLGFDNKVDMPIDGTHFLLENVGDMPSQFDLLSYRTEERFLGKRPVLLHMDLNSELHDAKIVQPLLLKSIPAKPSKRLQIAVDDPELGSLIKDSTFSVSATSDVQLLTEIATIREFLKALRGNKVDVHDDIPDVYWLKLGGLAPIVATYGANSLQFREAVRLLRQIISEVQHTMMDIYGEKFVMAVMKVSDVSSPLGYQQRKLLQVSTEKPDDPDDLYYKLNLAYKWDPNFPVIFAIILFLMVSVFLAVLGTSIAMWNMDPGKDSIIYRATTGRMKKD